MSVKMQLACFFFAFIALFHVQLICARPQTNPTNNPEGDANLLSSLLNAMFQLSQQIAQAAKAQDPNAIFDLAAAAVQSSTQLTKALVDLGADAQQVAQTTQSTELQQAISFATSNTQAYNIIVIYYLNEILYNACNFDYVLTASYKLNKLLTSIQAQFAPVTATAIQDNK